MRMYTPVNNVSLGELGTSGVQRKIDASQPIGHTDSRMQPPLAYVGKMVANIHIILA
jgi:hypothetical protein